MRFDEKRYEIEAKLEREVQLPAWYLDEPPQLPFSDFFLQQFWRLDTERPIGWQAGLIPESKVAEKAIRLGLPPDMILLFTDVILRLDRAYLKWLADERAKKKPPQGK